MAETPSKMMPLGSKAPSFVLIDTCTNQPVSLADYRSKIATVIMFISNHCPYVKNIQTKLTAVAKQYQEQGIAFIAICSNDAQKYHADGPDEMHKVAKTLHYTFPYLFDETQEVARQYDAACTPDFYVFDKDLLCVYRGRFDDSTPGNHKPVTGNELCHALDCILANKPIPADQKPSLGCNIKWK